MTGVCTTLALIVKNRERNVIEERLLLVIVHICIFVISVSYECTSSCSSSLEMRNYLLYNHLRESPSPKCCNLGNPQPGKLVARKSHLLCSHL